MSYNYVMDILSVLHVFGWIQRRSECARSCHAYWTTYDTSCSARMIFSKRRAKL